MIRDAYDKQLINCERGLQVHFCARLMAIFKDNGLPRRLFIEPTLKIGGEKLRSPDLLICDSGKVIGAIEFKYTPRQKSAFKKDLETLQLLSETKGRPVTVANKRYRGLKKDENNYSLSNDAVLCWAAIHAQASCPLPKEDELITSSRFLRLEARTKDDSSPWVFVDDKWIDPETMDPLRCP